MLRKLMNVIQNMKSGFANFKELFKIFLENTEEGYDIYINSDDTELAQVAHELQMAEKSQEQDFESFTNIVKKNPKTLKKNNIAVSSPTISKKSKSVSKNTKAEQFQNEK